MDSAAVSPCEHRKSGVRQTQTGENPTKRDRAERRPLTFSGFGFRSEAHQGMPQDRLLHPKLGHSDKVARLTDFEFRVWTQYLLSADDYGVMRASAVTLQADNDALDAKKARVVELALGHVLASGLVHGFEHQGRRYVYQRDWQDWQHVSYPRATVNPLPPQEELDQCSSKTQRHFDHHSSKIRQKVSEDFTPSRARETAMANGLRLTANGTERKPMQVSVAAADEIALRAGRLRDELYPTWYAKYRNGARLRLVANALEFQDALSLVQTWDDERLEKLARIVLTTDDDWIARTDRGFKIFATKASWADDRLREVEAKRAVG